MWGLVLLSRQLPRALKWVVHWGQVGWLAPPPWVLVTRPFLQEQEESWGPSLPSSSIVRSNRLPLSSRGVRHLQSSWTALYSTPGVFQIVQCTFEVPGPVPLSLLISPFGHPTCPGILSEGGSPFFSTHLSRVEHSTSHSFLVGQMAAWRLKLASRLSLWLECHWEAHPWSGEWTRILSTSWVPFCSSQCRTRFNCLWDFGWPQSLAGISLFSRKGGSRV